VPDDANDDSSTCDLHLIFDALQLAAERHAGQTRRDGITPYVNHPVDVARILVRDGDIDDDDELLAAALLHDTVEDTDTTVEELEDRFGTRVAGLVEEMTDDMSLPRAEQKRRQIVHAADLSPDAELLKLADKISNIGDLTRDPGPSSGHSRCEYMDWTERVIEGCRGVHPALEAAYDEALAAGREALQSRES